MHSNASLSDDVVIHRQYNGRSVDELKICKLRNSHYSRTHASNAAWKVDQGSSYFGPL